MQLGHLSSTIQSFFTLFTQSDQDETHEKEVVHSHSDISNENSRVSIANPHKRPNDDGEDTTTVSRKHARVAMDEKDKRRLMTFNQQSRQKVKETHSKTISFVRVKQLNPPKVRSISQSMDGFHVGSASDLAERYPQLESHNVYHQRFPMDGKTFLPFVMPFSTPSRGYYNFNNFQSRPRNMSRSFYQSAESPQRARPRFPPPPPLVTKDDLIDEFLKDADPFQWNIPIPCHIIEMTLKPDEKQSSTTLLSHDEKQEEGQLDMDCVK
ncbi:uncharacterized protein FA14DRAFT_155979 [Meira miltonrushii]|uniref:Uncharacterized protein n=1 Tax=Meira miltonrushii TaxID=1280837 RepID=A0A316VAR0_9BASI|nr:uncharacterized protein FA14DRAFT_155979 [Meira miltonrushii]PWN33283.1 hypothetical protein FA14DRAFT_155979 [Meira miltonrushii]